jgi:hypothetical protein
LKASKYARPSLEGRRAQAPLRFFRSAGT